MNAKLKQLAQTFIDLAGEQYSNPNMLAQLVDALDDARAQLDDVIHDADLALCDAIRDEEIYS